MFILGLLCAKNSSGSDKQALKQTNHANLTDSSKGKGKYVIYYAGKTHGTKEPFAVIL